MHCDFREVHINYRRVVAILAASRVSMVDIVVMIALTFGHVEHVRRCLMHRNLMILNYQSHFQLYCMDPRLELEFLVDSSCQIDDELNSM
jgi:hypothetical protein